MSKEVCLYCRHRGTLVTICYGEKMPEGLDPFVSRRVECRRRAPVVCPCNAVSTFPLQCATDCCGEFEPRSEPDASP